MESFRILYWYYSSIQLLMANHQSPSFRLVASCTILKNMHTWQPSSPDIFEKSHHWYYHVGVPLCSKDLALENVWTYLVYWSHQSSTIDWFVTISSPFLGLSPAAAPPWHIFSRQETAGARLRGATWGPFRGGTLQGSGQMFDARQVSRWVSSWAGCSWLLIWVFLGGNPA